MANEESTTADAFASAANESPAATEEEDLAHALSELDQFLERDPKGEEHLREALAHEFTAGISATTFTRLGVSLQTLLGEDGREVLLWPVTTDDGDERERRLRLIDLQASPMATNLLRAVLSTYGDELYTAYDCSNQYENNWRSTGREVFYDVLGERPFFRLTIQKFNGEEVLLEGPADSFLGLARIFVSTLAKVDNAEAFNPETISSFLMELDPLLNLLREESTEDPGETSKSSTAAELAPHD